jgi:hypothetical protein
LKYLSGWAKMSIISKSLLSSNLALYEGHATLVALLPRSEEGTLRTALDFCAESAKIKCSPKVPFLQRGSKAANVAYPI